ncbi:hypothetical protein B0H10DRAFT_2223717 [Mycena sp. CBHHK59/15]|nr:hypothetical protein B0H10DRAFT_2223717 [Mycena sp. CBHHK59/15]
MSARPSRKRRRSQAFPDAEEVEEPVVDNEPAPKYVESTGQARLDKEREVWDAFKDEHVEGRVSHYTHHRYGPNQPPVFDLSSSLWRRFDLVRELDQQDCENTAFLLTALMKYIEFRKTNEPTRSIIESTVEPETRVVVDLAQDVDVPPDDPSEARPEALTTPGAPMLPPNGASPSFPLKPAPAEPAPTSDDLSTRDMLSVIAKFSEASIRDREEKVNLTHAACESVERSIRLIDQAIQEQEHLISLGARPGTRLAPILLPELVMPKWTKPLRVTLSPDADEALAERKVPVQSRGRKKGRRGRKKEVLETEIVPLPRPKPPVIPNADPNESRYCYCDQVSFGEMIGCDDPHCEREWFHLTCTNLKAAPEGRKKWYCDDCTLKKNRRRNK